jgi:hypothetical protein
MRPLTVLAFILLLAASSAFAADESQRPLPVVIDQPTAAPSAFGDSELMRSMTRRVSRSLARDIASAAFSTAPAADSPPPIERVAATSRSQTFPALMFSYAVLNALDVYTTTVALRTGWAAEANPILAPLAQDPGALVAAKIAATVSTMLFARQVRKRHPAAAMAIMVAANVATGFIVTHNTMVLSDRR